MVALLSVRPVGDGKIKPLLFDLWRAVKSTVRAPVLRGTRCSNPVFVCSGGTVQVAVARSISSHVAVSDLTATGGREGQVFEGGDGRPMSVGGFDSPNSRGDLAVVEGLHVLGSLCVGTQSGRDTFIGWVVLSGNPWAMHQLHHRGDALFDTAGGFGFLVPYGGETGHDVPTGDLVYPFVSQPGDGHRYRGLTASALRIGRPVSIWQREVGSPSRPPAER